MSCDYGFFCVTCDESDGTDDHWNHAGDILAELLRDHRADLEQLGAVMKNLKKLDWRFDDDRGSRRLVNFAFFFSDHRGHKLVVRDEYRRIWDACGKDVILSCGHKHGCCALPMKHEGDCSEKAPT